MSQLLPGDRLPSFIGVGMDRRVHSSDAQAGRAAVLVLGGAAPLASYTTVLDACAASQADLGAVAADLFVLLSFASIPLIYGNREMSGWGDRILLCSDDFFASCGMTGQGAAVVVIDRCGRIVAGSEVAERRPEELAAESVAAVTRLGPEAAHECVMPAPLLAVPGLLDPSTCRELIERFEAGGSFDSGISGSGPDGRPLDRLDHDRKCRRDLLLQPGDGIHEPVLDLLARRCVPEIRRAFQYHMRSVDRILVARYDASIGHFKRHRDDAAPAVAHRKFALSANLNTGEYEGGHLLFPEFNNHRYRPALGEGLVFSASLLHEATRVLSGRRYVLLTFFLDVERDGRVA